MVPSQLKSRKRGLLIQGKSTKLIQGKSMNGGYEWWISIATC